MAAVARRYAQALMDLAREAGGVDQLRSELEKLGDVWTSSPDLASAFETPELDADARRALADAVSTKVGASAHVKNFFRLLSDRRRVEFIPSIVAEYVSLAEAETDEVRAQVVTAIQLDESYYGRLTQALESITGKKVTLEKELDPEILGGVIARVGGRVFDGSLRTRLFEVRESLVAE